MDNRMLKQAEANQERASNGLASIKGRLEMDAGVILDNEEKLKEASEKISNLKNEPTLSPEEKKKKEQELDAYRADLIAKQAKLKSSVEAATKQYDWVKSQLDVAKESQDIVVKKITGENEKRLKSLQNQQKVDEQRISNFKLMIDEEELKMKGFIRQREEAFNYGGHEALSEVDFDIKATEKTIAKLKDQYGDYFRRSAGVERKIRSLEGDSRKLKMVSGVKYSSDSDVSGHGSIEKKTPTIPSIPSTPPAMEFKRSAPTSDSFESTDDEEESVMPKIRNFPTAFADYEVKETSKEKTPFIGEPELFPEKQKPKPKVSEKPAPAPAIKQTPPASDSEVKIEIPPQPTKAPTLAEAVATIIPDLEKPAENKVKKQ